MNNKINVAIIYRETNRKWNLRIKIDNYNIELKLIIII